MFPPAFNAGSAATVATTITPVRTSTGYFYVWMAAACVAVAFGGFAPTYWLQAPAGTFVGAPIIHLHALLFSAWPLLLLSQTWLAANDRLEHHRAWGLAGVSLATAMLIIGVATAINSAVNNGAGGHEVAARAFMIVPVSGIVLFACLVGAAIANIGRPEWHKRLMLVASISILQAAMARVFFMVKTGGGPGLRPGLGAPQPVAITIGPGLVVDLLIVAGIVYDWRTRGRPHPAYLIAGGLTVLVQFARLPLSATPAWQSFAGQLIALGTGG
jgi:hypothetical protein